MKNRSHQQIIFHSSNLNYIHLLHLYLHKTNILINVAIAAFLLSTLL